MSAIGMPPAEMSIAHRPRGVPQSASAMQYFLHVAYAAPPRQTKPLSHLSRLLHAAVSVPGTFTGLHAVPMLSVVSRSHALVAPQPHCGKIEHGCVAQPLPSTAASIGFGVSTAASL